MSQAVQKTVAILIVVAAAVVVLAAGGALTAQAIATQRQTPVIELRADELTEQAQADPRFATEAHALLGRQTGASLEREFHKSLLVPILALAAVALVVGGKWLVALRGRRVALPPKRFQFAPATPEAPRECADGPAVASRRSAASEEVDLAVVDEIVAREGRAAHAVIPILQAIQAHYRYLPQAALQRVCALTEISAARLAGVASFYTQFRHQPVGRHLIKVCHGTACHVAGAERITDELRRHLRIGPGDDTDPAGDFTIEQVACMGCCTLAPVAQFDGDTHGHLQTSAALELVTQARQPKGNGAPGRRAARRFDQPPPAIGEVRIGLGSCCVANGSGNVHRALTEALGKLGVHTRVKRVGCVGMCHQTPLIEIEMPGRSSACYARVQREHVEAIVRRHFRPSGVARRLRDGLVGAMDVLFDGTSRRIADAHALEPRDPPVAAFLGPQKHIATEHCGHLDPCDLDEYLRSGGFQALRQCVAGLTPESLIEHVRRSGLRGRGGAGYPAADKWSKVRRAAGEPKYVICNGDEGDPGAFMDRMLMESYPYRIIEGLAIAARAVGAREGVFYIRREYPLAVERIRAALAECEHCGILGADAFGDGRGLRIRVVEGAGAFVCGEETALIASLEGRRGTPTLRPPYPAEQGLWGLPTLVGNVESYAVVPWILRHGPEEFAALGTPTSTGTKVFALAGKVARGGLIEVPMGITIRQIVEDIGGGVKPEHRPFGIVSHTFKAVQIGGPSGGCVPAELADTPVDFEALAEVGAIMGSGGLVVLDETDCMVDMARYFLAFTQDQSCGKCTPCRVGTRRMLEILERLCAGQGRTDDLEKLEELAQGVGASSICGLGKTAPNPVLTTLRYFRDEYEAHLQGRCPAGKCPALIRYVVTEDCTGCTLCAQHCPADAIAMTPYEQHEIDAEKCTRCDTCRMTCPEDAIKIT
jgi:NADH-quinone oxidoreductase subunit F